LICKIARLPKFYKPKYYDKNKVQCCKHAPATILPFFLGVHQDKYFLNQHFLKSRWEIKYSTMFNLIIQKRLKFWAGDKVLCPNCELKAK